MSDRRVANRTARRGKLNPGTQHVAGGSAEVQERYTAILKSLRQRREYDSDATRKRVAAATARKMSQNPGDLQAAEELAEKFHGRRPIEEFEVQESEYYTDEGAVLGYLVELRILDESGTAETPISFTWDEMKPKTNILVISNAQGTNIEFIGGDQDIDWWHVEGASKDDSKHFALVGPVSEITYFADKHHLSGPAKQKHGMEYYHRFGEDGSNGELPWLVFDIMNTRMMLVGGSYTIEPEGITG